MLWGGGGPFQQKETTPNNTLTDRNGTTVRLLADVAASWAGEGTYPKLAAWFAAMEQLPPYSCRVEGDAPSWRKVHPMAGYREQTYLYVKMHMSRRSNYFVWKVLIPLWSYGTGNS